MNTPIKIFLLLLISVSFLIANTSCRSHGKMCSGMKYYKQDKKKGIAH